MIDGEAAAAAAAVRRSVAVLVVSRGGLVDGFSSQSVSGGGAAARASQNPEPVLGLGALMRAKPTGSLRCQMRQSQRQGGQIRSERWLASGDGDQIGFRPG